MNFLTKRFLSFLLIALIASATAMAEKAMDLQEVQAAYPIWLKNYEKELSSFAVASKAADEDAVSRELTLAEIEKSFEKSIKPGSSMASNLLTLHQRGQIRGSNGDPGFASFAEMIFDVLSRAKPVELGGYSTKPEGHIVYLELQDVGNCNPYAENSIPKNGNLVRDTYPFIAFEEENERLRLSSLPKELVNIVVCATERQFE